MRNPLVKTLLGLLVLILLAVLLVPLLVNGETFRPVIESRLSAALHRKVTVGHLSFSLFSGSLVADNLSIADDPQFSNGPFLKANQLRIGVEVGPLLFHRQVHITRLAIDSPAIQLIQNDVGKWNYSSIGNTASRAPQQQQSSSAPDLTVNALNISNGSVAVSSVPASAPPFVYSGVNVTVKNFSFAGNFPFDVSANLPGNGTLKVTGTAGPISSSDASETPVRSNLMIAHLDPMASGLVEASKGISGQADVNAQVDSDGSTLTSSGRIKVDRLQLSRAGSPAPQPVNVAFNVVTNLKARTGRVNDIAVQSGSAAAHVAGTYRLTARALLLDLHIAAPGLPVDDLEQLLPALGIKVPAGSQLKGGTLTANLEVSGPATETSIAGPVQVENTRLTGFDLGSKIQGLGALTGTSGGTDIQKLSANLNATPQSTQISNIDCVVPAIGTATGAGAVSPSGALDFKLTATLSNKNVVGAVANQAINQVTSQIGGVFGGLLHGGAKAHTTASTAPRGIPLLVTGTTANPSIRANVGALLH